MTLAFFQRYRRTARTLNLSFEREVRKIARGFDLDADIIRNSFTRIARPRIKDGVDFVQERINTALSRISSQQLTTRRATHELQRSFDSLGLSPRNAGTAETLVRTHAQIAFSAAQWKANQNDPHGLITGYQFATVGDSRVRDEHAILDGIIRAKDDPFWNTHWPPLDFNCRCAVVELTDPIEPTELPEGWQSAVSPGFDINWGQELG
jgi:SPP1 gp7 family putative phage head morphogenesis protein